MKSIISVLLTLYAIASLGQSESIKVPRVLFKASPGHFSINTLKLGIEVFNQAKTKSLVFYGYGQLQSSNNQSIYSENYDGLGGELQYRKYISPLKSFTTRKNRNYIQGIYAGAYAQAGSFSREGNYIFYSYTGSYPPPSNNVYIHESVGNWGTGFTIGVQRTLWSVLFIDAYIGGGIQWSDITQTITAAPGTNLNDYYSYRSVTSPSYQGVFPKFGVQLGIAL